MTPDEVNRLAAAINALRPDWPVRSLRTFLGNSLGDRAYGDAAVALVWVATKCPETETPRLVLEAGPWWRASVTPGQAVTPIPPRRDQACPLCGRHLERCVCDAEDRQAQRRPGSQPQALHRAESVRQARAAIIAATGSPQSAEPDSTTPVEPARTTV